MASQPVPLPEDPAQLSDEELIRLCVSSGLESATSELWNRFKPFSENHLKTRTGRLCPPDMDQKAFVCACLYRAEKFFGKRIRKFKLELSFEGWLRVYLNSAARDERRERTRQRPLDPDQPPKPPDISLDEFDEERMFPLRTRVPSPFKKLAIEERKEIIYAALGRHACESPRNAMSTRAIILFFWQDLTVPELADIFLAAYAEERKVSLESRDQKMRRFLRKDVEAVGQLLKRDFSIASANDL